MFLRIIGIIAIASAVVFSGCKGNDVKNGDGYYYGAGSSLRTNHFGDEEYVWESFNFTTNRVEGL